MVSKNIITIVRDPEKVLGKQFRRAPDGTISKQSAVSLALGIAVQHEVQTHEELGELLKSVGDDPHAAIINSAFEGIAIGEEFIILSARKIEALLGIPTTERERQIGVHTLMYDGKPMKAVGRFKENVQPSTWQLLDRDIDSHTPKEFAQLTTSQWVEQIEKILPGVKKLTYVEVPSTSSRVMEQGKAVGSGNAHVWIKVEDPDRIEQVRSALLPRAALQNMTWAKPRFSRAETTKEVGSSLTTILDPSVWTPGRLVFDGKPSVGEGLSVEPTNPIIHRDECDALDLATIAMPDSEQFKVIQRMTGLSVSAQASECGYIITLNDLTLDTEVETKDHGTLTVREFIERDITGKQRCQTPFRDSSSFAGILGLNEVGNPYIHDTGTGITHWPDESEAQQVALIHGAVFISKLMAAVETDPAAVLEDDAVRVLATVKKAKPANYQRIRTDLKRANKLVSLSDMDRAVKNAIAATNTAMTHNGYAKSLLAELTEKACAPVGHHGELYVLNPDTNLWVRKPAETLIHEVADMHDGKDNCERASDYRAVAEHAISLATDSGFFAAAPNGLACTGGFYQIVGDEISLVPLTPEHRQRVMLPFTPTKMATPQFDAFLHETFQSPYEGEEQQQIALVQEIAGGMMLGILHKQQIAILFYEPFGRAGKGTLEKQLRQLVPPEFVTAISPFKWGQDYHVVTLAGKRLNVVGELPESEAIPSAMFKTVLGGDLVTGRHPTHRPVTFTNEAVHLFMSNHLITTKDQSEAFFARWRIVEFPNSRLRSGLPLDPNLAQRIIDSELPGIAYWALEGAARLLRNGKLSTSTAHDRLMAKWRRTTNSLEEFIHDSCVLSMDGTYRRSEFYRDYLTWCGNNGRKPFAKGRVKELLEHNVGMGIRLVELNGYETFCGVSEKPAPKAETKAASKGASKAAPKGASKASGSDLDDIF